MATVTVIDHSSWYSIDCIGLIKGSFYISFQRNIQKIGKFAEWYGHFEEKSLNYFVQYTNAGLRVDLALNCPKKKTPSHPSHCRLLSAIRDKRRVHAPWMTECVTKRREPIKPPERQSIAVSRSLTDTVGERIYCAVNNGARVTADRTRLSTPE